MLRRVNRYQSKEEQIAQADKYYTDQEIDEWIEDLKNPKEEAPEFEETPEFIEEEQRYTSCTARDYSPSNPWDAPGMSIRDFRLPWQSRRLARGLPHQFRHPKSQNLGHGLWIHGQIPRYNNRRLQNQ